MNHKVLVAAFVCLLSIFFLNSCQSREEKVIDRLEILSEEVTKKGTEFTSDQWENTFQEIESIDNEIGKCNFTKSQLERIELLRGRITAVILKEKVRTLGSEMSTKVKQWGEYCKGFMQGLTGNLPDDKQ